MTATQAHDLLTPDELIAYLRLDAGGGDPHERLRNLIRRHRLPVLRIGRLQRFRRGAVDAWLECGGQAPRRRAAAK